MLVLMNLIMWLASIGLPTMAGEAQLCGFVLPPYHFRGFILQGLCKQLQSPPTWTSKVHTPLIVLIVLRPHLWPNNTALRSQGVKPSREGETMYVLLTWETWTQLHVPRQHGGHVPRQHGGVDVPSSNSRLPGWALVHGWVNQIRNSLQYH